MNTEQTPQEQGPAGVTRRDFIGGCAAAAVSAVLASCTPEQREAFLQKRFKELTGAELEAVIARLERENKEKFKTGIKVKTTGAQEGVLFGYGLDISRCIGCRRCVHACVKENNQSRDPEIQWIRVLRMDKERGIDLTHSDPYYNPPEVPEPDAFYLPVACQQCEQPACVAVCPVQATYKEPDGIVVIDYNWCIGCRCCMSACPYQARRFNWRDPVIPPDQVNPDTHYLGNRPRYRGVVEKCTFCIQRVREEHGRYPACVEICPVGARKFGNLLDGESEIRHIMREKRVFILKEELNTQPKFFYFYAT
ncbi:MAG: 4Fe-4S dicluster domain-containing protein [Planctomycetia bacterium]|nr:4Fe-4S dicluster domain-containing protein [Planctomycetia bacterium]